MKVWTRAAGALCMLAGACAPAPAPEPPKPPSVLLLSIDTLRADHVGVYGAVPETTPHLDRLASRGVVFENAISTAPWTLPSFSSLHTGLYPHEHAAVGGEYTRLGPEKRTLAQILSQEGYATAAFVAAEWLRSSYGFAAGFDLYDDDFEGPSRPARDYQQAMITWLEERGDEPFFLWTHYFTTHTPYRPSEPFDRMYYEGDERDPANRSFDALTATLDDLPEAQRKSYGWLRGVTDLEFPISQYRALVTEVDSYAGELIATLERLGRLDDTIVVVIADHGEQLGEHHRYFVHLDLYGEVIHVPLIVSWPSGIAPGRVAALVQNVDVLPTIADYLGLEVAASGASLRPLIEGSAERVHDVAIAEWGASPNNLLRSVQTLDWKLVFKRQGEAETIELYDLRSDPKETRNVAGEHPAVVTALLETLGPLRNSVVPEGTEGSPLAPEAIENLRALGYVE